MVLDNKTKNRIIGALRQEFKYSALHKEALQRARIEKREGYFKNGREKWRVYYLCAKCKGEFKAPQLAVDHIKPIGSFTGSYDDWISKAWCVDTGGVENLQCLCKDCHKVKTDSERSSRKGRGRGRR